jgi:undecaprenyl pyrophosphate synthase
MLFVGLCGVLAPSDFHIFGPQKKHLDGQIPKCCKSARSCLTKSSEFHAEGVLSLVNHCDKCLNLHYDYAEIYAISLFSHEKSYFK